MKPDAAGAISRLIRAALDSLAESLHVGLPCKVVSFDAAAMTATVQPLVRIGNADPAVIQGVPALGQRLLLNGVPTICPPSLVAGDIVFVVCADREIKNVLQGSA
jgi:hypothetical protein